MARFFEPSDVRREVLASKRIAVIGYGNQGTAHALNLRDSGLDVVVAVRAGGVGEGASKAAGFKPVSAAEAARNCDVLALCLSDTHMPSVYASEIAPNLRQWQALVFVHGFNIVYETIQPPPFVDVALVAPKGVGAGVRSEYEAGRGVAAMIAVQQDATSDAQQIALGYAQGLGCFRSVVFETTFREETECDLFGEQAVLCGGIIDLVKMGFDTLVEAGYSPEVAYFECLHETKLIVDLLVSRGIGPTRAAISDTAEWGAYLVGREVVGSEARSAMKAALARIQSGEFARGWVKEHGDGGKRMAEFRAAEGHLLADEVGDALRKRMQRE